MRLHVHRLILLLLLLALPVYAQGPQGIYFPGTAPTAGGNGNFNNLVGGPGFVSITGDLSGNSQISNLNVNGVRNAAAFSGADIGAQVNNAVASLPGTLGAPFTGLASFPGQFPGSGRQGTIIIPNVTGAGSVQTYSFSTTMVLDQNIKLQCDPGVVLSYTGPTDAILQNNPGTYAMFTATGGVSNCTITKNSSSNGVNGIHAGNTCGLTYTNDVINGFSGTGDSALLLENTIFFTEHSRIDIATEQAYHAITFKKNCGSNPYCQASFGYNWVRNIHCGVTYGGYGDCINVIGGGVLYGSRLDVHANTIGLGQAIFAVDATSGIGNNSIDVSAENDANPPTASYMSKIATGGLWEYNVGPVNLSSANGGFADASLVNGMIGLYLDTSGHFPNWVRFESPGTVSFDFQGTGDATLYAGMIHPSAISGVGPVSVSGGGALQGGSNSMWGEIDNIAATGNVLTPGTTCSNRALAIFHDVNTGAAVPITAETTTAITFSGTAGHAVNYWAGCR